MKPKTVIVASIVTLGLSTLAVWTYRKFKEIEIAPLSPEYLAEAEYNREGFQD